MKVLVCGGRGYSDWMRVHFTLDHIHKRKPITCVVHGNAPGADTLSREWAEDRGVPHMPYQADWANLGPSAGPTRNQQMLDENPDIAATIAFPGGRGTEDMIKRSIKKDIKVLRVSNK